MKKIIFFFLFPGLIFASNINMVMTVDWEGRNISWHNIEAIKNFRKLHPEIPMLHFLNPAYYTKEDANFAFLNKKINSVLFPQDERGLHIHAWKSLVNFCGLEYKSGPSFGDGDENCNVRDNDCGHTVSLEYAYSQEELNELVKCSNDILEKQGLGRPKSFRAGGWQLGPKLSQALADNHFLLDSSRTDASVLIPQWGENSNLVQMVFKLHPTASALDRPFELLPGLMELPDNGCLADYTPASILLELFQKNVKGGNAYFVLGFHLETAANYLPQLDKGLKEIYNYASENNIQINWAHFPLSLK